MSSFAPAGFSAQAGNMTVKDKSKKNDPAVPVSGEIQWASLNRLNEKSNRYQYDLCHLSERAVKELETTLGIDVSYKDEKGFYMTLKSGYEIEAKDTNGDFVTEKIGNGTKAKALIGSYTNSYGTWAKPLGGIIVTDLVVYESENSDRVDLSDVEPF